MYRLTAEDLESKVKRSGAVLTENEVIYFKCFMQNQ